MSIKFDCACGRSVRAPDDAAGKKAKCPNCGAVLTIPEPAAVGDYDLAPVAEAPRPVQVVPTPVVAAPLAEPVNPYASLAMPAARPPVWRRFMYLVLLLGLIPLVLHTLKESSRSREERQEELITHVTQTIEAHQDEPGFMERIEPVIEKVKAEEAGIEELLEVLPNHKVDTALLPRDTERHWMFAGIAAGAAMVVMVLMFPGARKRALGLFLAGLFTGTIGIVLLLGFQYAASFSGNIGIRVGWGKLGIILLIIEAIGWSYKLAESDVGFVLSFIGFTCGVGLCEEITKSIPLLWRTKDVPGQEDAKWNDLLLIGLASGFGFGIAEGVMYSHRYYNGIESGSIYVVRFVSCVVLHAIWAGAIGVTLYNRKEWLKTDNWWGYFGHLVLIVLVPMILHGLYDTLLKMEYNAWALVAAVASFGWLAWQIERMHKMEPALA